MSPEQMSEICSRAEQCLSSLGREYKCSTRQCRRILATSAYTILLLQEAMLMVVAKNLAVCPPVFGVVSDMWDETSERLQMVVRKRRIRQTFRCFVLVVEFAWMFGTGRYSR